MIEKITKDKGGFKSRPVHIASSFVSSEIRGPEELGNKSESDDK